MAGFDPDAYLAGPAFDPDAYLGAPPAAKPEPGGFEAVGRAVGRGMWSLPGLVGLDHAKAQAVGQWIQRKTGFPLGYGDLKGDMSLADIEAAQRGAERAAEKAHPFKTGIGIGLGAAPSMAILPAAPVAAEAGLAARAGAAAFTGAAQGAAVEGGVTADLPVVERLKRMAAAGIGGAAFGSLGPARTAAVDLQRTLTRSPRLAVTPEAALLEREGVQGLTVGQKAPESTLGVIERASADHPFGMGPQREAARESFQRVAQDKGLAPGAQPPTNPDLQGRLGELFAGFDKPYSEIGSAPVPAASIADVPEAALRLPGGVDARTAAKVRDEVSNALTVLPGVEYHPPGMHGAGHLEVKGLTPEAPEPFAVMRPARGGEAYRGGEFPAPPERGPILPVDRKEILARAAERERLREALASGDPASRTIPGTSRPNPAYEWRTAAVEPPKPPEFTVADLQKVRENIRAEARAASKSEDFDRLRLLGHAEDALTNAIESNLSPESLQLLRDTDRQYARLMTAANAAPAGETKFTPRQYLRQVEKGAGRRNFKKGEAGDLQDLGEAARVTFENMPMTGLRPGVLSFAPGAKYWGAPVSRLANSEMGQRFLFGVPGVPARPALGGAGAVSRAAGVSTEPEIAALIAALRAKRPALGYPGLGFVPGAAEETDAR